MADDDLTAELARIAERRAVVVAADLDADALNGVYAAMVRLARDDSARLLDAVEKVLALADDWEAKAKQIAGQIRLEDCDGATAGFKMIAATRYQEDANALREAITTALTGEEAAHGKTE